MDRETNPLVQDEDIISIHDDSDEGIVVDIQLHDHFYFVKTIFTMLGIVALLPWNLLITATDTWMYKFRDIHQNFTPGVVANKTELQVNFNAYMSMANNVPYIFIAILIMAFGHRITATVRIVTTFISSILATTVLAILVYLDTDAWQDTFFQIVIALVVLFSLTSASFLSNINGIASSFPSDCIKGQVLGQAIAGLLAVAIQIGSVFIHTEPKTSGFVYFLTADLFIIATFIAYLIARKTPYFRFHRKRCLNRPIQDGSSTTGQLEDITEVSKRIWPHTISIFMTCFVTLTILPGLVVLNVPQYPNQDIWNGKLYLPISLFLIYNFGDFSGRLISDWVPLPNNRPSLLLFISTLRLIFIPLYMLCNLQPRSYFPVFFVSDAWFIVFNMLFGLSNGYLFAIISVQAPKFVQESLLEKVGFVLTVAVGLGVLVGSITAKLCLHLL